MRIASITVVSFANLLFPVICALAASSADLPQFDFAGGSIGPWQATHDVAPLEKTAEGLLVRITGADPYITSPPFDCPPGVPLWLRLRIKSQTAGDVQIFYYRTHAAEEASVRVPVRAGVWEDLRIAMPALGPGHRLRIDPPGQTGQAVIAFVGFEKRPQLALPRWPGVEAPVVAADSPTVRAGDLALVHGRGPGAFVLSVSGRPFAAGWTGMLIGYVEGEQQRWVDVRGQARSSVAMVDGAVVMTAEVADPDGGSWRLVHRFSASGSAIDVECEVAVDRPRAVAFLPLLMLMPGLASFGQSKQQAVFCGLEYLDRDEPSSSEADIIGPGSRRQMPDTLKITFPLMAVCADGRYAGLIWEMHRDVAAVFDSPDRLFGSSAHVMGLIFPGSNGRNRVEGDLLPHAPQTLPANRPLRLRAAIVGGAGQNIVPAVQQYVALRKLPAVPAVPDFPDYVRLAAAGWLDSKIREGDLYRHAWPGAFKPQPAADAAMFMDALAACAPDRALAARLNEAAAAALRQVKPENYDSASVSHVRWRVQSLLYGNVAANAERALQHGRDMLRRFEPDGTLKYRPRGVDYGKTHFAPDASGHTATAVAAVLECAAFSGDEKLIAEGLRLLRAMDKFHGTVPRGAQTWECPLHIPDILAAALLVKAYVLGFELCGDEQLLRQAQYWAWTGVPFVYLVNPTDGPVGLYATIAVFGATNWTAPNWMGLPVQWCGMVYADALRRLARYDESGPWLRLADGITASGIQQTGPLDGDRDRAGLLPDSFVLRAQRRADPFINPGTVQASAMRFYGRPPAYSFQRLPVSGMLVHAPCAIADVRESPGRASFRVEGCIRQEYYVLVSACRSVPRVLVNGQAREDDIQYIADRGRLIVRLRGPSVVEIGFDKP